MTKAKTPAPVLKDESELPLITPMRPFNWVTANRAKYCRAEEHAFGPATADQIPFLKTALRELRLRFQKVVDSGCKWKVRLRTSDGKPVQAIGFDDVIELAPLATNAALLLVTLPDSLQPRLWKVVGPSDDAEPNHLTWINFVFDIGFQAVGANANRVIRWVMLDDNKCVEFDPTTTTDAVKDWHATVDDFAKASLFAIDILLEWLDSMVEQSRDIENVENADDMHVLTDPLLAIAEFTKIELAKCCVLKDPSLSLRKVAEKVGISKSTLNRSEEYKAFARSVKASNLSSSRVRKGFKSKDGTIEAVADQDDIEIDDDVSDPKISVGQIRGTKSP